MSNTNLSPLWTLDTTFNSAHIFNGSVLYQNFSGSAANGSYNSSELWTAFSDSFNATSWTNGYPTYILFQGACLNGTGEVDCVAACSHSDMLFSSIQTLYNCFLAPYVSSPISYFIVPLEAHLPQVVAALQNPDPAVQEANAFSAAQLGLTQNSTVPDPVNITIECFASYCDAIGGCNRCDRPVLEELLGPNRSAVLSKCILDLCNTQQGKLDGDLGGIGVSISFHLVLLLPDTLHRCSSRTSFSLEFLSWVRG